MIKIVVNSKGSNTQCYQVGGIYKQNGKEIQTLFFAYADNEEQAKNAYKSFKEVHPIKFNLQTLANAQTAYKKKYGNEVDLESDEFISYIKR